MLQNSDLRKDNEDKETIFRLKLLLAFCFILCISFVFFAMFSPDIIENWISDKIKASHLLTENNQKELISGFQQYGITDTRRYTFFNFSNADEAFLKGAVPVFHEMNETLALVHNHSHSDPVWNEKQSTVSIVLNTTNIVTFEDKGAHSIDNATILKKEVTIPNIPSINLWQELKSTPDSRLAQLALGHIKDHWKLNESFETEIIANLIHNFIRWEEKFIANIIITIGNVEDNHALRHI